MQDIEFQYLLKSSKRQTFSLLPADVEEKLKDLYWFDAECFRIYYREGYSLSEMARETRINKNTLHKAITNVKNYLINEKD